MQLVYIWLLLYDADTYRLFIYSFNYCCYSAGNGQPQNEASVLYNAMIHPFLPLTIYGAIWYQGESNSGEWATYECAVRQMVDDWREKWYQATGGQTDATFPFGQCQVK